MHGADPGAGQHGEGGFGDHRKVQHNPVALAHAMRFQHIGHPADAFQQVEIGDVAGGGLGIIRFPDDRRLAAACRDVAVNAIG